MNKENITKIGMFFIIMIISSMFVLAEEYTANIDYCMPSQCGPKIKTALSDIEGVRSVNLGAPNKETIIQSDREITSKMISDAIENYGGMGTPTLNSFKEISPTPDVVSTDSTQQSSTLQSSGQTMPKIQMVEKTTEAQPPSGQSATTPTDSKTETESPSHTMFKADDAIVLEKEGEKDRVAIDKEGKQIILTRSGDNWNDENGNMYMMKMEQSNMKMDNMPNMQNEPSGFTAPSIGGSSGISMGGDAHIGHDMQPESNLYVSRTLSGNYHFDQFTMGQVMGKEGYSKLNPAQEEQALKYGEKAKYTYSTMTKELTIQTHEKKGTDMLVKEQVVGDSDRTVIQYFQSNNKGKLTTAYTIEKNSDGTIQTNPDGTVKYTLTESRVSGMDDADGILPFASEKWGIKKEEDTSRLTFKGTPGTVDAENPSIFKYDDDQGSVIQINEKDKSAILEQDENNKITITPLGSDGKEGEEIELDKEMSAAIVGDGIEESGPTDSQKKMIVNIESVQTAMENNRMKAKDTEMNDKGELKSGDKYISINEDGNVEYVEKETEEADFTKKVIYDDKGRAFKTILKEDGEESTITWTYHESGKKEEQLASFTIGDDTDPYVEIKGTGDQKNVRVWCKGSDRSKCINLDNGKGYKKNSDGEWEDCGEACDKLEESMKDQIEAQRVASGGPNNRELRAIGIFDWLETSQTGFGKLFSLFIDDETLAEWRQGVDDFFCSTVLFGGRDCWVSEVCGEYTDKAGGPGTLLIETPGGMLDATAHVEGERQELFYRDEGETKGEYLYKISFGVRTPDNYGDDIRFNVRIEGERTMMLYNEWIEVDEGDTFSKAGKKVLVEYSDYRYDRICIVFEGKIRKRRGEFIDELCNAIVPLAGEYYTILPSQNRMDEVDI